MFAAVYFWYLFLDKLNLYLIVSQQSTVSMFYEQQQTYISDSLIDSITDIIADMLADISYLSDSISDISNILTDIIDITDSMQDILIIPQISQTVSGTYQSSRHLRHKNISSNKL